LTVALRMRSGRSTQFTTPLRLVPQRGDKTGFSQGRLQSSVVGRLQVCRLRQSAAHLFTHADRLREGANQCTSETRKR
jgi:hypothetical protein